MARGSMIDASQRRELEAMLAAPERVEVHGRDRSWRGHLVGALLSGMAFSMGALAAHAHEAPGAGPGAELRAALMAPKSPDPLQTVEARFEAMLERSGAFHIARATRSTEVAAFAFNYSAAMTKEQLQERADRFVRGSPGMLPPVVGGLERTAAYLGGVAQRTTTPVAWVYASKAASSTGCVILMSDNQVPEIAMLTSIAGIGGEVAAEFVASHEAAHCAQFSETTAAIRDLSTTGKVRPERFASGLLDVRTQELMQSNATVDVLLSTSVEQMRSSERYADGFAVLALLARGRITLDQVDGIARWRAAGEEASHQTSSFLVHLRSQLAQSPAAVGQMQRDGPPGFDAQAIASFLKPQWRHFEAQELAKERMALAVPVPSDPLALSDATSPAPRAA